jgi:Zn-dependent peptidase ImmA (M78 family)
MNLLREASLAPSLRAKDIINKLQIREPSEIQIIDIAMERGVYVRKGTLESSEARLVRCGDMAIITVNNSIPEEGRIRFAIAHELGHYELHSSSQLIFCTKADLFIWNESKTQETEANEFAACILMPDEIFLRFLPKAPNLNIIMDLATKFQTTLTATALRYVTLSPEPCAVVITKDGIITWFRKSSSFNFFIKVGEKLSPNIDENDEVRVPPQPIMVPASTWLEGNFDSGALIFEHSLPLKSYGIEISLLWINNILISDYQ